MRGELDGRRSSEEIMLYVLRMWVGGCEESMEWDGVMLVRASRLGLTAISLMAGLMRMQTMNDRYVDTCIMSSARVVVVCVCGVGIRGTTV